MPKSCSIRACKSRVRRGVYTNRFFQFPSDPERYRLWASRCRNGEAWLPNSRHVYVCGDHFVTGEPVNNRGHPDYAPSLLLEVDEINKGKVVANTTAATDHVTRPNEAESSREIIKYDEYFAGGIPDSLLEGLGFSETDKPVEEDDEEIEMTTPAYGPTFGHTTMAPLADADVAPFGHANMASLGHVDSASLGHANSAPLGHVDSASLGHANSAPLGPADVAPFGHAFANIGPFGHANMASMGPADVAKMLQFGLLAGLILPSPMFFPAMSAPSLVAPLNSSIAAQSAVQLQNLIASHHQNKETNGVISTGAQSRVVHPSTSALGLVGKTEVAKPTIAGYNKSSQMNHSKRTPSVASLNPTGRLEMPLVNTNSQSTMQSIPSASERAHSYDGSSTRKITKGNIMYERLPTGEVIASVIKKPEIPNLSSKVDSKAKKPPPRVVQSPSVRHNHMSISNLEQCPSEYPVTEHNVMDVLEHSIQATHSMRLLLMTLRDDLRRTGGSSSAVVTGEQARKRREVAIKLSAAYAAYKESIDNIENARFPGSSVAVTNSPKPESAVKPTISTVPDNGAVDNCTKSLKCAGDNSNQNSSLNTVDSSSPHSNVENKCVGEGSIEKVLSCPSAVSGRDKDLHHSESQSDSGDESPCSLHIDET